MADRLPAAIWASILSNYCSYKEIRNCLEVSALFPHDVAPLIERLYIFHASEMHLEAAARFPTVKCVYIYSLTSVPNDRATKGEEANGDDLSMCLETARKVVPFLEVFPELIFTHIGGYTPNFPDGQKVALDGTHNDLSYYHMFCRTEGHQAAFRGMLNDFCDSFQRGSLDASRITFSGLFDAFYSQPQLDCSADAQCELCPRICQSFSPEFVFSQLSSQKVCVPDQERLKIIHERDETFLKSHNVLPVLLASHSLRTLRVPIGMTIWRPGSTQQQKVVFDDYDASNIPMMVWEIVFEEHTLNEMRFLIDECGCDPTEISLEESTRLLTRMFSPDHGKPHMTEETFETLTEIGFAISDTEITIAKVRDGQIVPKRRRIVDVE